jgi:hypothetical protein
MKQFVKSATFVVAFIVAAFCQPAMAAGGTHVWYSSLAVHVPAENNFSMELIRRGNDDVLCVSIQNPGRKNLAVTLNSPDGVMLDNFFTGRKFNKTSKQYNFSGAEEGVYTIIISDGVEKIKRQIKFERIPVIMVNRLTVQ